LKTPPLRLAIEFNRRVRHDDEWIEEPDDRERVARALASIDGLTDPVEAAAILAFRVTRAQGFAEGNKRTAVLLARWVLDMNGIEGSEILRPDDRHIADLMVQAASGIDVEQQIIAAFRGPG
jgi:prophage maintenance system killer protein